MQTVGLLDIEGGCYEGYYFTLEVKLPGKEKNLTARQAYRIQEVREHGGIADVVSSVEGALEKLRDGLAQRGVVLREAQLPARSTASS